MENIKHTATLFITGESNNRELARLLITSQAINIIEVIANICDICISEEIDDKRINLSDSCFLKFRGGSYKWWEFKLCSIEKFDSWDVVRVNGKCVFRDFVKVEETDLTSRCKRFYPEDDNVQILKNRTSRLIKSNKFKQLLNKYY